MRRVLAAKSLQTALATAAGGIRWLLRDDFTTDLPAGSVNGTAAEPIGGLRVAVDTNSKISIVTTVLNFATGAAANDGVWWATQARTAGRIALARITPSNTNGIAAFGWDSNQSGAINDQIKFDASGAIKIVPNGGTAITVGAYTATPYIVVGVMRATGVEWFIKGGAFTYFSLLWITALGTAAGFPAVQAQSTTSVFTVG